MKKCLFFLAIVFFFSCSSDATEMIPPDTNGGVVDGGQNPPGGEGQEEDETKVISISIQVNGDFFGSSLQGEMILSNANGEILARKELLNNALNEIDMEVDGDLAHDFTYLTRDSSEAAYKVAVQTFTKVEGGTYVLEDIRTSGNGDEFMFKLINTGDDIESLNQPTAGSSRSTGNGGSYSNNFSLKDYPGSFYAAFLSSNDSRPRYYYNDRLERNAEVEQDYTALPFVENSVNLDFPLLNIFSVSLSGFIEEDAGRKLKLIDQSGSSKAELNYPEGIYYNYKLSAFLNCCNDFPRAYQIIEYGLPVSKTFELPIYEAVLVDADLDSFQMNSLTEHHFNTVKFSNRQETFDDPIYTFEIHGMGETSLELSKKDLYDSIFIDGEVTSGDINFGSLKLMNHSFLNEDYQEYIQSILGERQEYPAGTRIVAASFFEASFR